MVSQWSADVIAFRALVGFFLLWLILPAAASAQGTVQTYVVDPATQKIAIHWKDEAGRRFASIQALKSWLEAGHEKLLFATNGGIFETDFTPLGLYIEDGKVLHPLNTATGAGNFYLQPNGVFYVDGNGGHVVRTEDFKLDDTIITATQSGPMLVRDGDINPAFTPGSKNILVRTGVGIDETGKVVFAKTNGMNFFDFATYFRDTLHCRNALYLDGHISQMYVADGDNTQLGGDFVSIISVSEPQ
jgi:uncharacterized protein YigE (DUF2233 family)